MMTIEITARDIALEELYVGFKSDLATAHGCDKDDAGDIVGHIIAAMKSISTEVITTKKHLRNLDVSERLSAMNDLLSGLQNRLEKARDCQDVGVIGHIEYAIEYCESAVDHLEELCAEEDTLESYYANRQCEYATLVAW